MIERLTRLCEKHERRTACDFCGSPDRHSVFRTPPGVLLRPAGETSPLTAHLDDGRWNACAECAAYVAQKNVPALVNRVVGALRASDHPRAQSRKDRAELSSSYAETYAALLAHPLEQLAAVDETR
jgi:hypothetical protein